MFKARENSTHGFEVRDYQTGELFFKNRPSVRRYSLARIRCFDLARNRKFHDRNAYRTLAIWDGSNAVSKIKFFRGKFVSESSYLIQPVDMKIKLTSGDEFRETEWRQALGLEKDARDWWSVTKKTTKTGRSAGDTTKWLTADHVDEQKVNKPVIQKVRCKEKK
jgi:hypothetical protein